MVVIQLRREKLREVSRALVIVVRAYDPGWLIWPGCPCDAVSAGHICVIPLMWARRGHSKVARFRVSEEQGRGGVDSQRHGKGKMTSPSVRRKILKDDCGREMMRKAECGLTRSTRVPCICQGHSSGFAGRPFAPE